MKTENISKIERATCIGLGVLLAASGINNMLKSPGKLLTKCLAGYHLIKMGKTGFSPINGWLEINTAGQSPRQALETYKENLIHAFTSEEEEVLVIEA